MPAERGTLLLAAPITRRDFRPGLKLALILQGAILAIVVANLARIPVVSTGEREAPILFNDLCVGAVLVVGSIVCLRNRSLRLDRPALFALAFAGVGGLSTLLAIPRFGIGMFELFVSLAYLARWVFYFGLYVIAINTLRVDDVRGVWHALETAILVIAGFGIIQAIFLPGFAQLVYPDSRAYLDWDPQGHRLVSTILDPNLAGAMLLTALVPQIAMIANGAKVASWKPLMLFAAMVLTLSRSTALGLIAGVATIFVVRGISKRMLRIVMVLVGLVLVTLPQIIAFGAQYGKFSFGGSAALRIVGWVLALRILRDHWLIGVGFNTYGYVVPRYGMDRVGLSSYSSDGGLLFIAVLTGVVGLTLFLGMLRSLARRCRAIWRDPSVPADYRGLAVGAVAAIVAVCVNSIFVNSLLTPIVFEPIWILFALTFPIAAARAAR